MRITVLTENTAARQDCVAEFGLSLLIEANGRTLLFDSGQSGAIVSNAEVLGVDLARVDAAVLSHGHFDHANGFPAFLQANARAEIYAHEGFDRPHWKGDEYIGVSPQLARSPRVRVAGERVELGDGFTIVSYAGEEPAVPIDSAGLDEDATCGRVPDRFDHEHYLIVEDGDARVLFTGCSHKGIRNIVHWSAAEGLTHIVGGFHLMNVDTASGKLEAVADELLGHPVDYLSCHCTGQEQFACLHRRMGSRIRYIATGDVAEL